MRGLTALTLAGHFWLVISSEAKSLSRRQARNHVNLVYRGDDRTPWEVREAGGFRPWGEGWGDESFFRIDRHYNAGPSGCGRQDFDDPAFFWRTAYVSLATDRHKASKYGVWLYEIRATPNILDGANADGEVMALGGVHWRQIRRYTQMRDRTGLEDRVDDSTWLDNPEYDFQLYEWSSWSALCGLSMDYPDVLESGVVGPGGMDAMRAGHHFMTNTMGMRELYGNFPPQFEQYQPNYDIPRPSFASLPPWEEDERRLRLFLDAEMQNLPGQCQQALQDAFVWGLDQNSCDMAIRSQVAAICGVPAGGPIKRPCCNMAASLEMATHMTFGLQPMQGSCSDSRRAERFWQTAEWYQGSDRELLRNLFPQLGIDLIHTLADGTNDGPNDDLWDYEGSWGNGPRRGFSSNDYDRNEGSWNRGNQQPNREVGRPMAQISSVVVHNIDNENPGNLFGQIKVTDRLGEQTIYKVGADNAQLIHPGEKMKLEGPKRPIEADTTFFIDFDLWDWDEDWSSNDKIGAGRFTWDVTSPLAAYDKMVQRTIKGPRGEVSMELMAIRNAVAARVDIFIMNGDDENPVNVFGKVRVTAKHFDYLVFDRADDDYRDVVPGESMPLIANMFAMPLRQSMKVRLDLWDYDSSSANDEIARETLTFWPQVGGKSRQTAKGTYGRVDVEVTWR
ncbi:putative heat-labile enterotoxin [Ophiocordyceps polyrhachis-furcata BCC 54312]|uniref:Heat-labile enterotoxin n=1 Tax=Ophiocordyceps polyrhachis-furcata BCC 54312 TaxID=1330021 RepID=A0A367L2D3_9HYPO|nr:putative heat-labile enterotoxin [Ophiocordyceps polyrhachis-furcata BCC 54312]